MTMPPDLQPHPSGPLVAATPPSDEDLVASILGGQRSRFSVLVRRHNQRLFRTARAIIREDHEAEDVVQQAYVTAYNKLAGFRGEAAFSTWLTRIVVNEAVSRLRRNRRHGSVALVDGQEKFNMSRDQTSPEDAAAAAEMRAVLEKHVDDLPDAYRAVFMLRDVEEMSTAETAECLGITEETVRVRLHRARNALQASITETMGTSLQELFKFDGERCDRIHRNVMRALGLHEEA